MYSEGTNSRHVPVSASLPTLFIQLFPHDRTIEGTSTKGGGDDYPPLMSSQVGKPPAQEWCDQSFQGMLCEVSQALCPYLIGTFRNKYRLLIHIKYVLTMTGQKRQSGDVQRNSSVSAPRQSTVPSTKS